MFEGLGPEKLVVILLIVLVLFGGKRIPEIGASLGKGIRAFKRGVQDAADPQESAAPARHADSPAVSAVASDDSSREPRRLIQP